MAWDDTKSNGPPALQASEWNAMVSDQKGHAARHAAAGSDPVTIDSDQVNIDVIGTPTYTDVKSLTDAYISAGFFEGGTITSVGDGNVDVAAVKGIIKTTASDTGENVSFDLSAHDDVVMADGYVNYVYVQYNGGTPILATTVDYSVISHTDEIILGRVYRSGTTVYISSIGAKICNATLRDMYRLRSLRKVERASGAVISNPSGVYIALTASVLFSNYDKITTDAFDSSGAGRWITWYRAAVSGFTQVPDQSEVNLTQYDDGTGTLHTLTGNYFSNRWFYLVPTSTGSQVHMVMGQGEHNKLVDCLAESTPSIPTLIQEMGILVGRATVQEGETTLTALVSAFDVEFSTSAPSEHNELTGIQGGAAGDYYHLTAARHTDLTDGGDSTLHYHSADRALASATGTLAVANGGTGHTTQPNRTLFLSMAGGVPSTTYGDGGFTTTECTTTSGATPTTFNMRGTQFDASAYDRSHEFGAPMPYNWDGGTVSATPFVMCASPPAEGTILILGISGAVIKNGEAATSCDFSVGASSFFVLSADDSNRVLVGSSATPSAGVTDITLTCNGTAAGGDWVQWKVSRAGYDSYAGNATVLGWIITYGTNDQSDVI